jgi:Tfp pilus assembly protein PilE
MGDSGTGGWEAFDDEGSAPSAKPAWKGIGMWLIAAVVMLGSVLAIGILAAIVVPNFFAMQMRSKQAEAPRQVEEIRAAQEAFHAVHGGYASLAACPENPGGDLRPWEGPCTEAWAALDWVPSGELRCTYSVEANPDDFIVLGRCDIDGDGEESQWSASRDNPATMDSANNVY